MTRKKKRPNWKRLRNKLGILILTRMNPHSPNSFISTDFSNNASANTFEVLDAMESSCQEANSPAMNKGPRNLTFGVQCWICSSQRIPAHCVPLCCKAHLILLGSPVSSKYSLKEKDTNICWNIMLLKDNNNFFCSIITFLTHVSLFFQKSLGTWFTLSSFCKTPGAKSCILFYMQVVHELLGSLSSHTWWTFSWPAGFTVATWPGLFLIKHALYLISPTYCLGKIMKSSLKSLMKTMEEVPYEWQLSHGVKGGRVGS